MVRYTTLDSPFKHLPTDPAPRSHSWTFAPGLYEFLTSNDSQEIPFSSAAPGDIIFFQDYRGIHHTAIVASVLDGHVFYAAHSGYQQNADWNTRQTMYDQSINSKPADPQTPIIVRPRQVGTYLAGQ